MITQFVTLWGSFKSLRVNNQEWYQGMQDSVDFAHHIIQRHQWLPLANVSQY